MSAEAATQTTPAETAEQPKPKAPETAAKPEATSEEPVPQVKKVQDLRKLLADKRAIRERDAVAVAAERGIKTRKERQDEAKAADEAKQAKLASKPASKDEKPKAEAKDAKKPEPASDRDESGRFLPKDGKPPAPKPAPADDDSPPPAAAKAAPAGDAKTDAKIDATTEKLEDLGAKVPKQGEDETDKRYEARISRMLLDAKDKDVRLRQAEDRTKAAEERAKKVDDFEKLIARVRADELDEDALEQLTGKSWVDLIKGVASGERKFKAKTRLPPELQRVQTELEQTLARAKEREDAIVREAKERKDAEEREATEARRADTRKNEVAHVRKFLEDNAENLPRASAAVGHLSEKLLDRWYATWEDACRDPKTGAVKWDVSKQPELSEVATKFEALLSDELSSIFGSERALRSALADPKTRELVVRLVAESDSTSQSKQSPSSQQKGNQTADADGPRTLSKKVTQEAVPTDRKASPDAVMAEKLERLAMWRAGRLAR
jgi:hypothetical protein